MRDGYSVEMGEMTTCVHETSDYSYSTKIRKKEYQYNKSLNNFYFLK